MRDIGPQLIPDARACSKISSSVALQIAAFREAAEDVEGYGAEAKDCAAVGVLLSFGMIGNWPNKGM